MKKSILEKSHYDAIVARINSLTPDAAKQWGKMDVAQMLAHCCVPIEQATGATPFVDESTFFSKTIIKWFVLWSIKQGKFGRNLPTSKNFLVVDEQVFEAEKQRLLKNLATFYEKGQTGSFAPHPSFGTLTTETWGALTYLHLNHHLEQFSA